MLRQKRSRTILCWVLALVSTGSIGSVVQAQLPNAQPQLPNDRQVEPMFTSRFLTGDEGFTEPLETIAVAAAEAGIVGQVHVKLGDHVKQGQLLMEMDMAVLQASRQIAIAKQNSGAKLRAAEVEYETRKKRYEKLVELVKDRAGTPEEVERAKSDADVAFERVQELIEDDKVSALEVQRLEAQLERRRIRSPIDGVVIELKKKQGEHVSSGDPQIATVVRLDKLRVVFHLPTKAALKMKRGLHVNLMLTETDQTADAVVEYVSPVTSADSGRVRMEVLIDNPAGNYRSGIRTRLLNNDLRPISTTTRTPK